MALASITRKWSADNLESGDGRGDLIEVYQIEMTSIEDMATDVRFAAGLPRRGDPHARDPFLYVDSVHLGREGPTMWEAVLRFTSFSGDHGDPLEEPPVVEWGKIVEWEMIERDLDGVRIANMADEPFDPPVQEQVVTRVLRIGRNEAAYDEREMGEYDNAVNDAGWLDYERGQCLMLPIVARKVNQVGWSFWRVNYEIHFRTVKAEGAEWEEVWKRVFLNQGFRQKIVQADGTCDYYDVVDAQDMPVREPVLLNYDGTVMTTVAEINAPVWLTFRTKKWADFSKLDLADAVR